MKDDVRVRYCARKAAFLLRGGTKRHAMWALELIAWALDTFPDAPNEARARLYAEWADVLDALGKKKEANAVYRKAKRRDPTFA